MNNSQEWQQQFGVGLAGPRAFFGSTSDLGDSKQGHVLRRAFDLLKLDGILCADSSPLIYFKELKRIDHEDVQRLHRTFWNHGGAPVLVLISPNEVHVYSGLVRPGSPNSTSHLPALVEILDRTAAVLEEFVPTLESGEYFRRHEKSFNPAHRVDRDLLNNLQATRDKLASVSKRKLEPNILDALLCRLVFACYLFDREIVGEAYLKAIGLKNGKHLRDVLGIQPRSAAKELLYDLFRRLGQDFNGDLFSDDLDAEASVVQAGHITPLDEFFQAADVATGQGSFWPYDFSAIPIEAISAIYERFLHADKHEGAFYTPRFLAELVLDLALADVPSLLGRRYLDPACGSGIFLVALFNRMAEEWKQANPGARNDRRARELREVLCTSLCGVDISPTACRITAFSLYLAYLDQLSPRDVQELKEKGHKLPKLVHSPDSPASRRVEGNIWCGDFFADNSEYARDADLVVGNPPWGSTAGTGTAAADWSARHQRPVPDKQISAAFIWKSAEHVSEKGKICLVLPHGTLFNHSMTALNFQQEFLKRHAVQHVVNFADYRFFLFAEALHPALVVSYRMSEPLKDHKIEYWAPKADWLVMRAEVISIMPEDRTTLRLDEVLADLASEDAPQVWKQRFWATARDRRLVDRLSLYDRLRDVVKQTKERTSEKRWLIAEGWQPIGKNDDPKKAKTLLLPSRRFIEAKSASLDLFLLQAECTLLTSREVKIREKSNRNTKIFESPHVLVAKGFTSIAFADFSVSFRHALRGISGPKEDRELLMFLAAFLSSPIAQYFLFHTSSSWGVSRPEVHVGELLRLPFPIPEKTPSPRRALSIVKKVATIVDSAITEAEEFMVDRKQVVAAAKQLANELIYEYFDVLPQERTLIEDTLRVIVPSLQPKRNQRRVPTVEPSQGPQFAAYTQRLCETLNQWCGGRYVVSAQWGASSKLGIGVAALQKVPASNMGSPPSQNLDSLLTVLDRVRKAAARKANTFELIRGAKVFDHDRLYIVKPIGQRFWTEMAALNDADEISGTILMHSPQEEA